MTFQKGCKRGVNLVKYEPFEMECPNCGEVFIPNSSQLSALASGKQENCFCKRTCYHEHQSCHLRGENNPHWKGGIVNLANYNAVRLDRYKSAKYVNEHILIMEEHIGRKLVPNEVVHHINGNKKDNRIENLQVMTRTEHNQLHGKLRAGKKKLKECTP